MTKIEFKENEILIVGHSNSERVNDNDLVCCACSTLAGTLANVVNSWYENNKLKDEPFIMIESGKVYIKFDVKDEYKAICSEIFKSFLIGFEVLQHQYPKNVKVIR